MFKPPLIKILVAAWYLYDSTFSVDLGFQEFRFLNNIFETKSTYFRNLWSAVALVSPPDNASCARVYFSLFVKNKSGDSYAVNAVLALSNATIESLNSHPDKIL